ncbi:MAG: hypothetical protein J6S45_02155 [Firmicutes bacterium]|nr:hypothetical protein [Bacillota bacterium]
MKQIRWIVAAILILAMLMLSGCTGNDAGNNSMVNDGVVDDGTTGYSQNHNGNGGVLSDIADGMENGIDRIKNGMNTVEDDMRTDLGNDSWNGN